MGRVTAQTPWRVGSGRPRRDLGTNPISGLRLYFMYNTQWFLNLLKLLMTVIKEEEEAV